MRKKIIAVAAALMLLGTNASAYENCLSCTAADPMNNDLFEIVAEVNSDVNFYGFSNFRYEDNEDKTLKRIAHYSLSYDGSVTKEVMTDFMTQEEAYDAMDEFSGWKEELERGYVKEFNDGLAITDWHTRMEPYAYEDINGNFYLMEDNMRVGWNYDYNIGIMMESQVDTKYVANENGLYEFGDDNTFFYTLFSNDMAYLFEKAAICSFDDNGYAVMRYGGKQYVVKLKRGFIPTVFYNGEKIKFDQIPVIENGRTLVPLRAIFEKIGAEVKWDENTKTVTATKDGTEISLTLGSTEAIKNGEKVTLDTAAKSVNGRTLVPVRFIADCFGVTTDWDGTMQRVSLSSAQN